MASDTSSIRKERLLEVFNDNNALITAGQDIASEIQSGDLKLYVFVEDLGCFVTDKDVSIREKGISLLSTVLSHLPKGFLNETELRFITSFYCDRLKDHHSVIPAVLRGILAIIQMEHLPNDSPASLSRALFERVPCQSQLMSDRRTIYLIFSGLVEKHLDDLKAMGPDFTYGVISSIDMERDPRNLILLFTVLPDFIRKFSLGHLAEEMFEAVACYFPVDFNPSGSEGLSITREDLAEKLEPCLCAIPEFAEFCIPLVNDKLFSSLKVAKLDSLKLICRGAPIFGTKGLEQHLVELWSGLRKELMPGGDVELKHAALKALTSIVKTISDNNSVRDTFIDKIITDTKSSLCDVQLSLFRPAESILETVAMTNKESCVYILRNIFPLCLGQYSTTTSLSDKVILVEAMNRFLKISADHGFSIKSVPELSWTDIPQLYLNELSTQHTELKSKILQGLSIQKLYINDTHRTTLYNVICNEIESGCDQIRAICYACILAFAMEYSQEVLNFIKERMPLCDDTVNVKVQSRRLEALSAVAKTRELGIQTLLEIVSQMNSDNFEISFTALSCIHRLTATKNIDYDIHHYLYAECDVIEKLISFNIEITDPRMNLISNICRLIVKNLTAEKQQQIVNKYSAFLNGCKSETVFTVVLNIFIPLRQNVAVMLSPNLLESLYDLAINGSDPYVRRTICQFTSVALNKIDDETYFEKILSYFKDRIRKDMNSDKDMRTKQAVVTFQVWLTKAAVTKGSSNAGNLLGHLISFFKHNEIGHYTAQQYKILTSRNDDALTMENFCNLRFLYKQRIFEHLIHKNADFKKLSRQNYLTALVQLLDEVPVELLFMKLEQLVPLLIESLSLENEELIFSTLTTLKPLISTKNPIFSDKAQCFIPRLLKLSSYATMRVRIAALECLTNYCYYPIIVINTYKQDVLEKLLPTLDDRKRLVRRAATKARTKWFLVGAPGGIKD